MKCRRAALVLGALIMKVDGQCLSGSGHVAGTSCPALNTCTDEAPNNKGLCKTKVIEHYYCADFATVFGTSCLPCTCKDTCEADGFAPDLLPVNWRPGLTNPYGAGNSGNGLVGLTQQQQDDIVKQHNFVRAYHGACPLQWDNLIAQNVADVAPSGWSNCEAVNSDASTRAATKPGHWNSLGENVVVQSSLYFANNFPVRQKTMSWYLESANYDFTTNATVSGATVSTSSFTQVVWKDTTHIGCQMYQCDYSGGKRVLLVCQYGPTGNIAGENGEKVGAPGTAAVNCTTCANLPSMAPTYNGTQPPPPTKSPTKTPTRPPLGPGETSQPSLGPATSQPSGAPAKSPTLAPSSSPTAPTGSPVTSAPTPMPTDTPTSSPSTSAPTIGPRQANVHEISNTKAVSQLTTLSSQTRNLEYSFDGGVPITGTLTWGTSTVGTPATTGSMSIKVPFTSTYRSSYMMTTQVTSQVKIWIAQSLSTTTDTVGVDRLLSFKLTLTGVSSRKATALQFTYSYEASFILSNDDSFGAPPPVSGSVPVTGSAGVVRPNHYYLSGTELLTRLNGLLHHFVSPRGNGKLISATVTPMAAGESYGLNVETTLSKEPFATFDPFLSTYISQIAAALGISSSRIVSESFSGGIQEHSTQVIFTVLNTDITPAPTPSPPTDSFPAWALGLAIFLPTLVVFGIVGFLMMGGSEEQALEEETPEEEEIPEEKLQEAEEGDGVLDGSRRV